MAWRTQGTWRERKGIHSFINFALAPERSGLFESSFWQKTVMQACFSNDAVFHVASAIGALQEYILQQAAGRRFNDSGGLAFALRQCNKAISLLMASTDGSQGTHDDPGIPLITCVLFAIFEALNGNSEQAIIHSLQGRKLFHDCETLAHQGRGSRLLDPMSVRPVIGGLEIQAKAIQGIHMDTKGADIRPPMPDVEHIYSLEHANRALQYTYINILVFCQGVSLAMSPAEISFKMEQKAQFFAPWLQRWEQAFSEFLFQQSKGLSFDDVQRAKVLKANHLVATMLATIDQGASRDIWAEYDNECKAVIDLSASVLNTYSLASPVALSAFQFPYLTFGLWVAEPLFIVMSRCRNRELQRQAAGLLNGQPRANHAEQILIRSSPGFTPDRIPARKDTDDWDTEKWIEFCQRTRLDAAMATYFSRLPSDYIDKPVYHASSA